MEQKGVDPEALWGGGKGGKRGRGGPTAPLLDSCNPLFYKRGPVAVRLGLAMACIPWPKPDGYDPEDFLLIQRGIEASDGKADFFTRMPPSSLPGYPGGKGGVLAHGGDECGAAQAL